jgi:trans-2-enoyl-CoA reductase
MKRSKIVLLALLLTFVLVGMAQAGTQVQINQQAMVKAEIQNVTHNTVRAAVKLFGYDDAGTVIGHLCQETYLGADRTTTLEFNWQAPAYATGVYWSPKVEVGGSCVNQDITYDHDSDSDSDDYSDYYYH